MAAPFRLAAGDPAPAQQSSTTCGSASLTVARMLADPAFADWIRHGVAHAARRHAGHDDSDDDSPDGRSPLQRFAAYEQVVAGRTNGLFGAGGRLQPPWPRALGTPPWGARRELELGVADPDADYDVHWLRLASRSGLERAHAGLLARVRPGRPALLYVGSPTLPRHVVLVLPPSAPLTTSPAGPPALDVYEPSAGRVLDLRREPFVNRRLALAGWNVPWALVWADPAS